MRLSVPSVRLGKPKFGPPKIAAVHIRPVSNGLRVTHVMSGPHPNRQFVFQSPAKMVSHLKRISDTAWLRPNADEAPRMARTLDLGETP